MPENELRDQIKRKLNSYNNLRRESRQLLDQLEQLRATIESPRGQAMDGMPRGSGGGDAMAAVVAELIGLQEKYTAKLAKVVKTMAEVEDMLDGLGSIERQLLRYRYIDGLYWEEVCVRMNYSWRQTHNIHSRALDKLVAAEMEK